MKVIHRAISTFLIKQAGLKKKDANTGAVTLLTMDGLMQRSTGRARAAIQRFGSAANLNIHFHCLFLDGVYRRVEGKPLFQVVPPPTEEQLQKLLHQIMQRLMKSLTRQGFLTEEAGMLSLKETDDIDPSLVPLHSASCTYRIALGPKSWATLLLAIHGFAA